jgi:prepilin-type N-terminal cleavage/methylation domain-containing protein/prepilin-type processing-associated H-X9-DG protein
MKLCLHRQGAFTSGFTLVEVLVTITIMGILAALVLAGVQKSKDLAERAKCVSNLRGISAGVGLYVAENDGYLPPGSISGVSEGGGNFVRVLEPYTAPMIPTPPTVVSTMASDMFYCPTNVRLGSPPAGGFNNPNPGYKGFGGYMINYLINGSVFPIGTGLSRVRAASVQMPSRTVALMDLPTRAPGVTSPPTSNLGTRAYFDPGTAQFILGVVHGNSGNVLFVDGHVEAFGKTKLPVASLPTQTVTWWP